MNMREKMARALDHRAWNPTINTVSSSSRREESLQYVDLILDAMREPSQSVLISGDEATWEPDSDRPYVGELSLTVAWQAMIDAIKAGK